MPAIFQAPINAAYSCKMKIGLAMDERALCEHLTMDSQECPFLRMRNDATMALRISATCIGPSTEAAPNRKTDPARRAMRVTNGTIASAYDGSLTLRDV